MDFTGKVCDGADMLPGGQFESPLGEATNSGVLSSPGVCLPAFPCEYELGKGRVLCRFSRCHPSSCLLVFPFYKDTE